MSGDLLISFDRVRENAKDAGVSFQEELRRVIIHGCLHLKVRHKTTLRQYK